MQLKSGFEEALRDYLLLMEKDYPQKATLKLVSDRYRLTKTERSMLFRGVVSRLDRQRRKERTLDALPAAGTITIDGFNVMRMVASYLIGRPVYVAMDGFLRDASELHGRPLKQPLRLRAFNLILQVLNTRAHRLVVWFDSPVSLSGETAAVVNNLLVGHGFDGIAATVRSADYQLKQVAEGVVATADSAVIEHAQVPVVDLAKHTLYYHFQPNLLDLRRYVS